MSSKKCGVCDASGTTPCENCFAVYYCCKKHQEKDWSKHKMKCRSYKIEFSNDMGRFMVSTRDIKPGEIILQESPAVVGPQTDSHLLCLGCLLVIDPENVKFCTKCGVAPVCTVECELKPFHAEKECRYYRERLKNVTQKFLSNNMQVVTPLRCLMLQEEESKMWEAFINLESHYEKRQSDPIWHLYLETIFNTLKSTNIINMEDQILIQKICGILDINSFELRGPQPGPTTQGEKLRGVYLRAALMSHDCVANTHLSVDDNFVMTIRASVPIKEGDPILFNYANPLEATAQRMQHLREGKYFTCTCVRCTDPTELGTYMGSIICSRCHSGFVIPENPTLQKTVWFCPDCNHKFHERLIKTTISLGWTLIENTDPSDYKALNALLKKLLKTFPNKGVVMIDLKQKLVTCLQGMILRTINPNRNLLKLKIHLCNELLETINIIEPGISRLKGIILFELYKPKITLANKEFEGGEITAGEFLNKLRDCEKILKEAISLLIYEPYSSPEGRLNQTAIREMKILREDIAKTTILC